MRHIRIKLHFIILAAIAIWACWTSIGYAADFYGEFGVDSFYSSNVYLDAQQEWDIGVAPRLALGVDFADFWGMGYAGQLGVYTRHSDLLFHKHELYLVANPAWGGEGENEFFGQLSVATQRNDDAYSYINYVRPSFDLKTVLEPEWWIRLIFSQSLSYRWFYGDVASDSVDLWTEVSVTFTAPTRTTLAPRASYGFRYYPRQDLSVTDITMDHQLVFGVHFSQGLWERAGLQADYAYLYLLDESGLISRQLDTIEISYVGEEFLFTGHRAEIGFKQLFENGWRFGFGILFETRDYLGWLITDENGNLTDENRRDQRLLPSGWLSYVWLPDDDASRSVPGIEVGVEYFYVRQWSNDPWWDTEQHVASISLDLSW